MVNNNDDYRIVSADKPGTDELNLSLIVLFTGDAQSYVSVRQLQPMLHIYEPP